MRRAIAKSSMKVSPLHLNPAQKAHRTIRRQNLTAKLEKETQALSRWQRRLARAFTAIDKLRKRITRTNKELQKLEATNEAGQSTD